METFEASHSGFHVYSLLDSPYTLEDFLCPQRSYVNNETK